MKKSPCLYGQSHSHDNDEDHHHLEAQDKKRPPLRPHRHSTQSSNGRSGNGISSEDAIDLLDDTDDEDDEIIKEQRTDNNQSPSSSPMNIEVAKDEERKNSINKNKRKSSDSLLPREKTKKIKTEDAVSSITTKSNEEKPVPLEASYNKLPSGLQQSFPCGKTTRRKIKTEPVTATDNKSSTITIIDSKLIKAPAPKEVAKTLSDPTMTYLEITKMLLLVML